MTVRVRLFAAVREAAGTAETQVEAGPLRCVLDELRARHGEQFSRRLEVSVVVLDGRAVAQHADLDVPDGAEIAVLPPVSGGHG